MKEKYFKNVLKGLDEDFTANDIQLNFIVLKGYEYWLRVLRTEKRRPDTDDCLSILPRKNAENVLMDVVQHFETLNKSMEMSPKRVNRQRRYLDDLGDFDEEEDDFRDDLNMPMAYNKRKKTINAIKKYIETEDYSCEPRTIGGKYLDNELIFDAAAQKVFFESFQRELYQLLKENADNKEDSYLKRIKILQKTFNLSELEMEITLFAWIFFNKDICETINGLVKTQNRFSNTNVVEIFPKLYPNVNLEKVLSYDGTIKKMNILDDDLDISRRVGFFLDGRSGNDLDSLY